MGVPNDGPSGHYQETRGFCMYSICGKIQFMYRIPIWQWTVFGCQTVQIGCDKCVIRSVRIFVQHGGRCGGPAAS